jgi:serine/threonine protein phosphatase PrpC
VNHFVVGGMARKREAAGGDAPARDVSPMPDATALRCRAFELPKQGNSRSEYEDASAVNCADGRFAVADGASESVFAGEWAALLCKSFVAETLDPANIGAWRGALQQRWLAAIDQQALPWYLEEKFKEGAYATFLGLAFAPADGGAARPWEAVAIGDSCLFHVRKDALLTAFPLERADEFGTYPNLIGSRQRANVAASIASGGLERGDLLLLMTDALSEWFLHEYETGATPWSELVRLREADFAQWVDALRESNWIKNDDVTLLVVEIDAPKI